MNTTCATAPNRVSGIFETGFMNRTLEDQIRFPLAEMARRPRWSSIALVIRGRWRICMSRRLLVWMNCAGREKLVKRKDGDEK